MRTVIECVPNFSEGADPARVEEIADAVRAVPGLRLLNVSSDASHNRSVLTFVGDPAAIRGGVLALFEAALPRIDLMGHRGEHPRMGAVDVVPLIPIRGATVADCVALSRELGEEIGRRFGIPVYLYEDSAASEGRRNLADVRKGQFEGLAAKMEKPEWKPDFGPDRPHPTAGAVAIGARAPLIAYNINLATRDLAVAERIAKSIRNVSGGFRYVKAMGVNLADRGLVQVSINMTNYRKTPLHRVFECVRSEADRHGVAIVGSEIVGLMPAEALYQAAEHYLRLEGFSSEQVLETQLLESDD
ncbi:MAG: glutamate formimidoyltransferase [Acidobacteriota bacterium]|nr:glutamate formimidoyltransferase [Acidobacteriota bacterium]MDQ2977768.1 glutamate formimidoyltransferase [Acidobacteriota bacterium]